MEIINKSVREDFYEFYIGNGTINLECDYLQNKFKLVRKINENESMYYPYDDEESANADWAVLVALGYKKDEETLSWYQRIKKFFKL